MNPFDDSPRSDDYFFSGDPKLIDSSFVIREIKAMEWGAWRTPITILKSIDNSLCFGVYYRPPWDPTSTVPGRPDEQVGFARVVTDDCTFAWICDVVISAKHRKKGLGRFLVQNVMANPRVGERACLLSVHDPDVAKFYMKLGFQPQTCYKHLPIASEQRPVPE